MSTAVIPQTAQIVEPDDGFTLRLARKPEAIIAEATLCANALMAAVRKNEWAQKFGNKEHLFFEAWAFLATMYRVTPRVKETRLVQIGDVTGYEAFAEAFHVPSGVVISTADSMCLDDEENWDTRPEYDWQGSGSTRKRVKVGDKPVPLFQLRSMAQTRAMAKALRGPFSWIVAMAGYAPRAAEHMTGNEAPDQSGKPTVQQPQQKPVDANGAAPDGRLISEPQRKRLWAIARGAGWTNDQVISFLKQHGIENSDSIPLEKYDFICNSIEAAPAVGGQR